MLISRAFFSVSREQDLREAKLPGLNSDGDFELFRLIV